MSNYKEVKISTFKPNGKSGFLRQVSKLDPINWLSILLLQQWWWPTEHLFHQAWCSVDYRPNSPTISKGRYAISIFQAKEQRIRKQAWGTWPESHTYSQESLSNPHLNYSKATTCSCPNISSCIHPTILTDSKFLHTCWCCSEWEERRAGSTVMFGYKDGAAEDYPPDDSISFSVGWWFLGCWPVCWTVSPALAQAGAYWQN
jgi:hypothetical protein